MKVLFVNKKKVINIGVCIVAACLLIVGAGMLWPGAAWQSDKQDNEQPPQNSTEPAVATTPEPYRNGDMESKNISLAVNVDWGEEYIPDMLKVLADNGVQATFFLTGRWCGKNPELASDIAESGHELGNHGYSHASPNASSAEQITEEIEKTAKAIDDATGVKTTLYAPPSGECEQHVLDTAALLGYDTILWSVDTIDWQKPSADTIIERVKNKIHGGAIILSHPTQSTVEALSVLLEDLKKDGYTFVTVSDNLGL